MANSDRYVELWVGTNGLTVYYDCRDALHSNCYETYSKYLYIQQGAGNVVAKFIMRPRATASGEPGASFQFYDGPYESSYLTPSGGYLYTKADYDYFGCDLPDGWDGGTMKLWTRSDSTKYWFKRGDKYESYDCGSYYYVQTSTNPADALTFQLKEFSPG